MTYTSNIDSVIAQLHRGIDAALVAAATIPMEATRKDLLTGFKGGKETHGRSAKAVNRTDAKGDYSTGRFIQYGTPLLYNLYWTIGSMNAFTRQFERVDKWTPHFYESQPAMLTAAQEKLQEALA